MDKQQIKLFLSVDIYGSTKLKNSNNYYRIQNYCQEFLETLNKINSEEKKTVELKEVYASVCEKYEHQDWAQIIHQCFNDFNIEFIKRRAEANIGAEIHPWKMAGDELIYCITVKSRKEVYKQLLAFFMTLRFFDKEYASKENRIRLKGSAWTAGFPIRNRIMKPLESEESEDVDDSKLDYMGPEIDIGFRIGKYTFPGIIVCSLELVCILLDGRLGLQNEKSKFRVIDTGWESLKGVWNGKKYPIYWLALPEDMENNEDVCYVPYKKWDLEEDEHVRKFADKLQAKDFKTFDDISQLINQLPKEFDIEMPYFVDSGDDAPEEHKRRIEFIKIVDEYQKSKTSQNTIVPKSKDEKMNSKEIKKRIDNVFETQIKQ